jgi:hypothetical protein
MTYVWNSTAEDAGLVDETIGTTRSEVVTRIRFADMSCHGTLEIGIGRVKRSEIEVVDSRWVCADAFVVEVR